MVNAIVFGDRMSWCITMDNLMSTGILIRVVRIPLRRLSSFYFCVAVDAFMQ
jgi:hypothetical protein